MVSAIIPPNSKNCFQSAPPFTPASNFRDGFRGLLLPRYDGASISGSLCQGSSCRTMTLPAPAAKTRSDSGLTGRADGHSAYKNNIFYSLKCLCCTNKTLILHKIGDGSGAVFGRAFYLPGPRRSVLDAHRGRPDRCFHFFHLEDPGSELRLPIRRSAQIKAVEIFFVVRCRIRC
jgi:hypothetical protein